MASRAFNRQVFRLAAVYDGLIGAGLLLVPDRLFRQFNIVEPNHPAFAQFPGALLLIFAAMYFKIAHEPAQYRHLIPYGIARKAAYVVLAGWYWINPGIPTMWKTLAVIDLVMGVLFAQAYLGDD